MKVLVLGASGVIGRHTAEALCEELQAVFERFDEASYAWGMENDVDNPALEEAAHLLQAAWLQFEQTALDAMPFEDPRGSARPGDDGFTRRVILGVNRLRRWSLAKN